MKPNIQMLLFFCIAISMQCSAQPEVFLNLNTYYAPGIGSYVEADIMIFGPSIAYTSTGNNEYQGSIEVALIISKNNEVVKFDKYFLKSEPSSDSISYLSLIDKKRFPVPNGVYSIEAKFTDVNVKSEPSTIYETFIVDFNQDIAISDITIVDTFWQSITENVYTKSGVHMVPMVLSYFPDHLNKLSFYAEIYNADVNKDNRYLAIYSIRKANTDKTIGALYQYKKLNAEKVSVILHEFDISTLPSGNYDLTIEIKDKENLLKSIKRHRFQRNKTISSVSIDSISHVVTANTFVDELDQKALIYYIKSTTPIASIYEGRMIKDLTTSNKTAILYQKQFLYNFWNSRDPLFPYEAFLEYNKKVRMVNQEYATTIEYGFETERGRIYLQYGAPNEIVGSDHEPGVYPYEIWKYYQFSNGQSNVKFVFYSADRVTNNYTLIHSTANGELRNESWQRIVNNAFENGRGASQIEETPGIRQHFGSKVKDNYND